MDKNFFKKIRILDGGMGHELHAKGLVSKGTLWMTSAVIEEKYHKLIIGKPSYDLIIDDKAYGYNNKWTNKLLKIVKRKNNDEK